MKRLLLASRWWFLAAAAAVAVLPCCSERRLKKEYLQPCKCGTAEHDVLGCTGECRAGTPCDNPLCTCEPAR